MTRISDTDLILNADGSVYHLNLRPEQVANTILTVGDPDRVARVSRHFDKIEFKSQKREFITHTGTFRGSRFSVISTGIGPDNVEIFFHEIDALFNVDLRTREPREGHRALNIIRVGTSGAMQEDIAVGTHMLSDYAAGLDNLMNFYSLPQSPEEAALAGDIQKHTGLTFLPYLTCGSPALRKRVSTGMITGHTVTCPGFYAPQGRRVRVPIRYPALLDGLSSFRRESFHFSNFEMETSAYFAFGRLMGHETASANAIVANRVTREFAKDGHQVVDDLIRKVLESLT